MAECVREATGFTGYPVYEREGMGIYSGYKHAVATVTQFFRDRNWQGSARVFAALSWEFITSIWAGLDVYRGKVEHFTQYGMNPKSLSEEQKKQTPVLLLHGRDGSQGMFSSMGQYFQENKAGPMFSINLADGELTEADFKVVNDKINEIQALYGREVKIDLIGYSRGAELAFYMALDKKYWSIEEGGRCLLKNTLEWRKEIGKIIRIGSMTLEKEWSKITHAMQESIYEIRGKDDIHMPGPSYAKNQYVVDGVGHVGLVSSPLVFDHLKSILP